MTIIIKTFSLSKKEKMAYELFHVEVKNHGGFQRGVTYQMIATLMSRAFNETITPKQAGNFNLKARSKIKNIAKDIVDDVDRLVEFSGVNEFDQKVEIEDCNDQLTPSYWGFPIDANDGRGDPC